MLCPQCDMLVALPPLAYGSKAVCPRCKTTLSTRWDEPRKRPIGYALSALFMLVLANIFPFINMRVAGLGNEIRLIQIPEVMVAEDYASMATLFMVFVQLIPAFCMVAIVLLCASALAAGAQSVDGRVLFQFKPGAWWKFSSPGAGQLRQADGLRRYRHRQQPPIACFACCRCAPSSAWIGAGCGRTSNRHRVSIAR